MTGKNNNDNNNKQNVKAILYITMDQLRTDQDFTFSEPNCCYLYQNRQYRAGTV